MKTKIHGTTWRSARVLLAGAIATATMASGNAALANGNRNIAISGNSTFSDCGAAGSDFGLLMTGDLKGRLSIFVQSFTLELSGSCIHHIDGRSGVFADAEGVFTLFDVITNVTGDPLTGAFTPGSGANNFLYYGRIRTSDRKGLAPAAFEDDAAAESRSFAADSVAVKKARSGRAC